jgi:hypothetical protein
LPSLLLRLVPVPAPGFAEGSFPHTLALATNPACPRSPKSDACDPHGFHPSLLGRRRNGVVPYTSEACTLDLVDVTYEREVQPMELVVVNRHPLSVTSACLVLHRPRLAYIFEYIGHDPNSQVDVRSCMHASLFMSFSCKHTKWRSKRKQEAPALATSIVREPAWRRWIDRKRQPLARPGLGVGGRFLILTTIKTCHRKNADMVVFKFGF